MAFAWIFDPRFSTATQEKSDIPIDGIWHPPVMQPVISCGDFRLFIPSTKPMAFWPNGVDRKIAPLAMTTRRTKAMTAPIFFAMSKGYPGTY